MAAESKGALVAVHLPAARLERKTELGERMRGQAVLLPHQPEEEVLRTYVRVAQVLRLLLRKFDRLTPIGRDRSDTRATVRLRRLSRP
jgi:hypothetical protein